MKRLVITNTFKEGDIICSTNNFDVGLPLFFRATDSDVQNFSNKKQDYYKIIDEPITIPYNIENELSILLDEYKLGNGVERLDNYTHWLGIKLRTLFKFSNDKKRFKHILKTHKGQIINTYTCVDPTKGTLTKYKKYHGYMAIEFTGGAWNPTGEFIHVINDNGIHARYKSERFKKTQ
jgi:hypothetical protein